VSFHVRSNINGKTGSENSTEVGRRKITKDRYNITGVKNRKLLRSINGGLEGQLKI